MLVDLLFIKDLQYGSLQLTAKGADVLKGEEKFICQFWKGISQKDQNCYNENAQNNNDEWDQDTGDKDYDTDWTDDIRVGINGEEFLKDRRA